MSAHGDEAYRLFCSGLTAPSPWPAPLPMSWAFRWRPWPGWSADFRRGLRPPAGSVRLRQRHDLCVQRPAELRRARRPAGEKPLCTPMCRRWQTGFRQCHGSIVCKELLGLDRPEGTPRPEARTPGITRKRPCPELARSAADILEQFFERRLPHAIGKHPDPPPGAGAPAPRHPGNAAQKRRPWASWKAAPPGTASCLPGRPARTNPGACA